MAVPKSASITFRTFTSTTYFFHNACSIHNLRNSYESQSDSYIKTEYIFFFYLFKAKRVEAKPPHKFGESTFETMPKDASREIEKTPKYFIK